MPEPDRRVCAYCKTINAAAASECLACGAPFERAGVRMARQPQPGSAQVKQRTVLMVPRAAAPAAEQPDEFRELARTANLFGRSALLAYSLVWRTLAEAFAIGLVALVLGLISGMTGTATLGLPGAVLVGIAVGRTRKRTIGTLLGAPGGAMLGLALGFGLWFFGLRSPEILVLLMSGLGILGAIAGGRPPYAAPFAWWSRLRPWLGGLGGFGFGLLGIVIGWGLAEAFSAVANP